MFSGQVMLCWNFPHVDAGMSLQQVLGTHVPGLAPEPGWHAVYARKSCVCVHVTALLVPFPKSLHVEGGTGSQHPVAVQLPTLPYGPDWHDLSETKFEFSGHAMPFSYAPQVDAGMVLQHWEGMHVPGSEGPLG